MEFEHGPVQKLEPANICLCDAQDEVIVIPVSEYKHLIRCEAVVDLMDKALDRYGEYGSEPTKIMSIALKMLQKEGSKDAE